MRKSRHFRLLARCRAERRLQGLRRRNQRNRQDEILRKALSYRTLLQRPWKSVTDTEPYSKPNMLSQGGVFRNHADKFLQSLGEPSWRREQVLKGIYKARYKMEMDCTPEEKPAVEFERVKRLVRVTMPKSFFCTHTEIKRVQGEPLGNPKIFDALRILNAKELFGMSYRRLNISTVGVIPGIRKLTEDFPQVNLAFSLHSPFTEERNKLVPLNKMFPMGEVFDALDQHIRSTGRRIWICYLLLDGINDSADHARALAQMIRDRPVETRYLYHVNLLPYNVGRAVPEHFNRLGIEGTENFQRILQEHRVTSSYRNSFGHGIDAACGQLFAGYEEARSSRGAII
ncbi:Ribosomal RNA large subunit methyltransferase Cfr (23S rRNA (adenine(2503)-C(8))-methyltransferase) (23S rRNA m8A2503 methyltransferase) [Durusdinium trenchii]|uniref:Ribosomal RNA large subunit methyltransferase Cfr (23S rRNA (Adenine(2503)-C(8))-methyltransferase) (23S rRNA m8A2503 methyltransferase) n=1 Tax=Durusdinium trenchii TaxID=1381693 RepID=A0ABP0LGR7_9DINO